MNLYFLKAKSYNLKTSPGFTLIELLVVIAIIGLLSTIIVASLSTVRAKARDTKRRADLKQLQLALELYQSINNTYPSTGGGGNWHGNCSGWGGYGTSGASGWIPNLAPTYIPSLSIDPNPAGVSYCYIYNSDGLNYKILAYGTTESVCPVPSTDPMYDPSGRSCSFSVYTPGAASW